MDASNPPPTQHVYRGHGSCHVRVPICDPDAAAPVRVPTVADSIPARWIMSREVICAREDLDVTALMDLMVRRRIGCVPVVDDRGRPIGMVTKFDLIEQLLASQGAHTQATAADMMMPIAISLDEHATIAHVAAMMAVEDVHHVAVIAESGALIGVISSMDIVRWLAANDGVVASGTGARAP